MKITEENFIEQLKHKNEEALEYVITQYGWIIKSIVRKQLCNLQSYHEECVNDILMGVWNNIGQFDPTKNHFSNWIAGISKYKTFDYMRKYLKDLEHQGIEELEEAGAQEETYEIGEGEEFDYLLVHLNEKDRDLFKRLYVEGQTMKEVADQTGMKAEVIYNRVSRGKRKLRELFQGIGR